jgi:DNA-binding transcriptional LysR family regulator
MTIDARDLEVFLAVVEHGSFGRAATTLLMTQPSVSERIAHLERTLGQAVFHRSTRGAHLTPAGEQLLPYASRGVAVLAEAANAVRDHDNTPRFRVSVHTTFTHRAIPLVLSALDDLPRRVTVRDAHTEDIIPMILDGVADIGFVVPGSLPRGLRRFRLAPDPVICVAAADHPLARKRRLKLGDLYDTYIALNRWGSGAVAFTQLLADTNLAPWRIRELSDARTAATLALHHQHIAVLTRSTVADELQQRRLHQLPLVELPTWNVDLEIIHKTNPIDATAISRVTQLARQRL